MGKRTVVNEALYSFNIFVFIQVIARRELLYLIQILVNIYL